MVVYSHTNGPWTVIPETLEISGPAPDETTRARYMPIAEAKTYKNTAYPLFREVTHEEAQANAERIVRCVNACEGLDPDAVRDLVTAARALIDHTSGEGRNAQDFEARLDGWESDDVFVDLLTACDRVENRA